MGSDRADVRPGEWGPLGIRVNCDPWSEYYWLKQGFGVKIQIHFEPQFQTTCVELGKRQVAMQVRTWGNCDPKHQPIPTYCMDVVK